MNRLASVNKNLSADLNILSDEVILRRVYQYTLDFSNQAVELAVDKSAENIILKLRASDDISQDELNYLQALVEKHDEIYFDLEDEGSDEEAAREFIKARAFAAVRFLAQYRMIEDVKLLEEAIYEASTLLEDPAPYFDKIGRLLKN
ncbi:hypothetical protein [Sphingobacterium detergens]|uniref:Uncharacterized protein n=1 Tax=Sphingobacterium detergens TaxID=1145106 RepID=A0A420BH16_SPHD1|nr:hypothetical protein [Sphingobacterium detergens]RKE56002.1 hypothetical protein DFQ12_0854 [Sphingobacterium detergens]